MGDTQRVWRASYPAGVPAEIDTSGYGSLVDLFEEAFRTHASRAAMTCMGASLDYAALDAKSRQLGAWLQSLGLAPGARVALMMPNVLAYPVAIAAVLRAGYVVVNVNPLYTPRELEHQLKDSGAEAIVILENFAHVLQKVLAHTAVAHVVVASMGDLMPAAKGALVNFVVRNVKKLVPAWELPHAIRFKDALAAGARMTLRAAAPAQSDLAFLQYTGGTTGVSKGAMLTHGNVLANVLQSDAWMQPALEKGGLHDEQIVIITALPLYHIFALTCCCLLGWRSGAQLVLIPNPRDIGGLVATLAKTRFHVFPAVNTLYNAVVNHPEAGRIDFSRLRIANGGGMAVQEAVANKFLTLTGCPIIEGYGLSETSPSATCNPVDTTRFSGTIGLPLPSTDIAIRDDAGQDLPFGEAGEICIRGPQVMAGYWNRPDETAKVMSADGFFKSGDIGIMDPTGYIRIVDRKKDMILVSGFNVYPNEIEGVVAGHPGVLEVAAVGVPDPHSTEAVKLFVVRKDPTLTEDAILAYCRENLTAYKCPKFIEFRSDLPKSNVGKILRRELRTG